MLRYLAHRVIVAFGVLLASSMVMYTLTALSADPLRDLYDRPEPSRSQLIAARTEAMRLDLPLPLRYLNWLTEVGRCVVPPYGDCTLGTDRLGVPVSDQLFPAMGVSIRLVLVATVASIVVGMLLGVVSALRQYSALDLAVTLFAFLCFSLPTFWFAGLLKQYLAVELNDWLADPALTVSALLAVGVAAGLVVTTVVGGRLSRQLLTFGAIAVTTSGMLFGLLVSGWFTRPGLGWPGVATISVLGAVTMTALFVGLRQRRILAAALVTALTGVGCHVVLRLWQPALDGLGLAAAALLTVGVSATIGWLGSRPRRRSGAAVCLGTGLVAAFVVSAEEMLLRYPDYFALRNGRPVPTAGSGTPSLEGDTWLEALDTAAHLLLPTVTLMLVAVAGYVRYTRASVLEVRDADHVRAAYAKGMPHRFVVVRHVLRNALTPLLTLVGFDFVAVIGGSVVIETLFGWTGGLGNYFTSALTNVDLNPVMGVFLVTAAATFLMNLLVDVSYGLLDPRVRLT